MTKHVFRTEINSVADQKRAVIYRRVSTSRQETNAASLPSQLKYCESHCASNNWRVVEDFVEAGTATDDSRPVFQRMMEQACAPEHPFDFIVIYAFNRFFRDGATVEFAIRKLRKHGVELVSATQPMGDDPSQILVRQIIGAFDEHTSREISKNTKREVTDTDERLRRLYRSIENGVVELDDILRERTATLKAERERAKAAYLMIGLAPSAARSQRSIPAKSTPSPA